MPLTHVQVWDHGWKDISIDEAIKNHPGGRVSAESGLFMCKLCHQFVCLTKEGIYTRHFRHQKDNEKSQNCPDKVDAFSISQNNKLIPQSVFPIKVDLNDDTVMFMLGLYMVDELKECDSICIKPIRYINSYSSTEYKYSISRVDRHGITYLPIGDTIALKYVLEFNDRNTILKHKREIDGVDPDGCLFDYVSGKKLPFGSDVVFNRRYYLLNRWPHLSNWHSSVQINRIRVLSCGWYLYEVCAVNFDDNAARFFLDYGYVLTEIPAKIMPLWPVYSLSPYIIKHYEDLMFFYMQGEQIQSAVYPPCDSKSFTCDNGQSKVILVNCRERQQLISIGRNGNVFRSEYLWKTDIESRKNVDVSVCDIHGNPYKSATYNSLPDKHSLIIFLPYDGCIKITEDGIITNIITIVANTAFELDSIKHGQTIEVFIGLDVLWTSKFVKTNVKNEDTNDELMKKLIKCRGRLIAFPTELRCAASMFPERSMVRMWLYKSLHNGTIYEDAYKLIIQAIKRG